MIRNRKDIKQSSFKKKNILLIQTYLNLNNWFLIQNVMVLEHSNVQLLLGHHHKCMEHCQYTICHNEWHICDVVILCESGKNMILNVFFCLEKKIYILHQRAFERKKNMFPDSQGSLIWTFNWLKESQFSYFDLFYNRICLTPQ